MMGSLPSLRCMHLRRALLHYGTARRAIASSTKPALASAAGGDAAPHSASDGGGGSGVLTESAADSSRRTDVDRSRQVKVRGGRDHVPEDFSRTYVREEEEDKATADTLPEILQQDLHRRQHLKLLRKDVRIRREGSSGLAHTPDMGPGILHDAEGEVVKRVKERNKHKIAAHRRFLSHPKVKSGGSPAERAKMDKQRRINVAVANISDMRKEQAGVDIEEDEKPVNESGYTKLVEGKIQVAMAEGQFDRKKLKYAGLDLLALRRGQGDPEIAARFGINRPSSVSSADFILNRMMKDQGAGPPWIQTRREIDQEIAEMQEDLRRCWEAALRRSGGNSPAARRCARWGARVGALDHEVARLNKRVRDFNLTCPTVSQRMGLRVERELERVAAGSSEASAAPP